MKNETENTAPSLLQQGIEAMKDRATSRDNDGERSMAKTIKAFNALADKDLTEEEGWLFMVCLKEARAMNGKKRVADDYIDGAAYLALQGECALRERPKARARSKALKSARITPLKPGDRVSFSLKNQLEVQSGTVYQTFRKDDSLQIRPDKDQTMPYSVSEVLVIDKLPSTSE